MHDDTPNWLNTYQCCSEIMKKVWITVKCDVCGNFWKKETIELRDGSNLHDLQLDKTQV